MSGLDLLIVNPGGTRKKVYQSLAKEFSGIEPPSWAALTAGFIRNHGYEVDILDASALNLNHYETLQEIDKRNPSLTAFDVHGQQANTPSPIMTGVGKLATKFKQELPGRPLIMTGWHPTALPKRTIQEESTDYVAEGEGFYTLLGLLEKQNPKNIPGLWRMEDGVAVGNPPSKNVENLTEELNDIAWDLLPMDKYRAFNWHALQDLESRTKYASLYSSLGCPYACDFCSIRAQWGGERKVRNWDPDWVLDQIDTLVADYDVKHLKINDELFVLNPEHFMPIIDGLIERDYGLNIAAFARVDITSRVDLKKFKRAGINWLELGIESADDTVLANVGKGSYREKDIREVVTKIHDAGIDLCANFVFGLPGETYESMQKTRDLCFDLMPAFPSFFCAMAAPGSNLYNSAINESKEHLLPKTWEGFATQGYDFLPYAPEQDSGGLTATEILRFRDDTFNLYFRNPGYQKMIGNKFGSKVRDHVASMAAIDLKRKLYGDPEP